jgi:microsomal dipeptidase-like Zn-dependent dipeptidase
VKHLSNNILHIVRVGGKDAWDHICIGSDFDGMVDAVDPYNNTVKLRKLREDMIEWLPKMANSDPNNLYYINYGNVEKRVDSIMFKNAFRFLKTNFN